MESASLNRPLAGVGLGARLAAVPASAWATAGLAALTIAALVGFLVYPTYPNYDSYYSLLWAREVLHLTTPSFTAFRSPTEHPLAILVSLPLAAIGRGGDRVWVLGCVLSFVALAAGLYRLGRLTFGPLVGAVTVVLLCTRFDFPFLAARGYIDIPYLAMIAWAAALEVARPRRGLPVFALLAAGSLLRPEAWVLAGVYWIWCSWRAPWRRALLYLAFVVGPPLIWAAIDWAATGDPMFSLHHTGDTAEALGRAKGLGAVPGATANFLGELDKGPVIAAAALGLLAALWYAPRRTPMPLVLFASGMATFVMVGFAGLSVIERYLLVPSLMVMLFAAVAIGGWTMLRPGSRLRRAWALLGALLVIGGVAFSAVRVNLSSIVTQLTFRGDSHRALASLLRDPAVQPALRCGAISVPTHKLVPDTRWLTHRSEAGVVSRENPSPYEHRAARRGLAIVVSDPSAVMNQVFTDPTIAPLDDVAPPGFVRVANRPYYAAYARC